MQLTYTAIWAAAISLTSATPMSPLKVGGFSVTQRADGTQLRYGPLAMARTYLKYGVPLPESLQKALNGSMMQKRFKGSVENRPLQYDIAYVTEVQIGTPPQTVPLDFDTGSADLWVSGPLISSTGKTSYNPMTSNTTQMTTNMWSISYGDGSGAAGTVFEDVVSVGGIAYQTQAVEVANMESQTFTQQNDYSGIFGLAFSSINQAFPNKQTTWFDNVKSNLDAPVFTADLKNGKPGTYDFGYIDNSKYTGGKITYVPVDNSGGFWKWDSTGYQVGSSGDMNMTTISGIADTGTTLLYLPTEVVEAYYSKVQGSQNNQNAGGYTFPCNTAPPEFSFGVGESKITIPAKFLNYAPNGDGTCFGGIQDSTGLGFSIFGDIALKAAFVVFDGSENPRLGWASKEL